MDTSNRELVKGSELGFSEYAKLFLNEDDHKYFTDTQLYIMGESIWETLRNCVFEGMTLESSDYPKNVNLIE